ncbi:cytochrome c oxidase accessory protein CcoG [Prolixibacteraceae bacterium JC049]|nr:cytochrome c oxidase accessory protein CcoG [Prolixibacteraceae bacterium JC049]
MKGNPYFRDQVATVSREGDRVWVYAKEAKGRLTNYRKLVSYALLILFFGLPFVKIGGAPIFLFDFLDRQLIIFGIHLYPQDFHLMFLAMLTIFVLVILVNVSFGRIWCGWLCPQTLLMEFVFRKIEFIVEGDHKKQRILNSKGFSVEKLLRKSVKHALFFSICFIITNTFLAYIIGVDELWQIISDPVSMHLWGFIAALLFTLVMYVVFSQVRELVCTFVCPYGRLQGVLSDSNTIMVSYDYKRGEPRGAGSSGDCFDCKRCIAVCPTGIDIRNGTQLECINCTACIDECNQIMDQAGYPKGLIRYASENMIASGSQFKLTFRIVAYIVVVVILLTTLIGLTVTRSSLETTILRTPGSLYMEQGTDSISNVYNYKVVNKTASEMDVSFKIMAPDGHIRLIGKLLPVPVDGRTEGVFFIDRKRTKIKQSSDKITIGVFSDGKRIETVDITFVGPTKP